jgi:hypothetical protein
MAKLFNAFTGLSLMSSFRAAEGEKGRARRNDWAIPTSSECLRRRQPPAGG